MKASYLVGIQDPEFSVVPKSDILLLKISQRISTSMLLPEQRAKADIILKTAKENFQICDNEYFINSLLSLYKRCLHTYTRLAMSQIRALELENRPDITFSSMPTFEGAGSTLMNPKSDYDNTRITSSGSDINNKHPEVMEEKFNL